MSDKEGMYSEEVWNNQHLQGLVPVGEVVKVRVVEDNCQSGNGGKKETSIAVNKEKVIKTGQ